MNGEPSGASKIWRQLSEKKSGAGDGAALDQHGRYLRFLEVSFLEISCSTVRYFVSRSSIASRKYSAFLIRVCSESLCSCSSLLSSMYTEVLIGFSVTVARSALLMPPTYGIYHP